MSSANKRPAGKNKSSSDVKAKKTATSKLTKNVSTAQNNTSAGDDQSFLFVGKSSEDKEDEWLDKIKQLMKTKKNEVDTSDKYSQNLKRLYDALLKELSTRCGVKYESVFDTTDDGQSETEITMNVTPSITTNEKDLLGQLAASSAKHQELNEENNKLKDQLKSYQENLKKFEKQADEYKKELDAKTAEINLLKQNISEMKRISEIEKQEQLTKPPENTGVTSNLEIKNVIQDKTDSSNTELIERLTRENEKLSSQTQQLQQTIDALTKENTDVLKQKDNLEKGLKDANNKITTLTTDNETTRIKLEEGYSKRTSLEKENRDLHKEFKNAHDELEQAKSKNVNQGKTDSSNKEQIIRLTDENEKIKLKYKDLQQQQKELQQQQRDESQRSKEKINILTAEKESLETVVSQIKSQMEEEKRKINKEKKFAALGPDQKLKELQEDNEKLRDRLSKVAGMKLTEGNPAIADLGDPNRPTQLGEKFAEMYDNEWTDAMEELANAGDEKSNINTLKNIVEKSYEFGKTRAAHYVKGLEKALLDISNSIEVTDIISKYIKDHRKNTSLLVIDGLHKSFVSAHSEYNVGGDGLKNFIKKAVALCWLMAIQDPPVVLTTKLTGKFDTDRFRHYTKSGSTVDYVVWPVMFLHEGGPIICKGVAQGK